jgi:hypothetical protein
MVSRARTAPGLLEQETVRSGVLECLAPVDPQVVMLGT